MLSEFLQRERVPPILGKDQVRRLKHGGEIVRQRAGPVEKHIANHLS